MTEDYERRLRSLESQNLGLQMENRDLQQRLVTAESAIDELEQYGRRNALRITNEWPEREDESTDNLVLKLANDLLGVELQESDISRSHRVGPSQARKPRSVLVKFTSYRARERVYRARMKLKTSREKIFINEDLTKKRGQLAYNARQLKKDQQIQDTWTYDCRVFVKNNKGEIRVVNDGPQLEKHTTAPQRESRAHHSPTV